MRITEKTKYSKLVPVEKFLKDKDIAALKQAAEKQYGAMYDLTFTDFHACSNGDFASVLGDFSEPTVLQVYWCKRFEEFVREFVEALSKLNIQQTPDEKKAAAGLLTMDWAEGMLIFVRNYFGLPSFKAAEQITMGEILIAKRAQYNSDLFQRNMSNMQMQKYNKKK